MAIVLKSREELDLIKISGDLLGRLHGVLSDEVKEGVSLQKLDQLAFQFIKDFGGVPSFLNYKGYPNSLCLSVNETVVHGIPSSYILKNGDVLSIDCGIKLNGFHSDSAYTHAIGEISEKRKILLQTTKESLLIGISKIKEGLRIGDMSFAIQNHVEKAGFSVVRELVGHGIGRFLHEEPEVPNFGLPGKGPKFMNGMVLAIEPMVNEGKKEVVQLRDGWTINTKDGKASAHFEHTVAIWNGLPEVLTTFKYIQNNG